MLATRPRKKKTRSSKDAGYLTTNGPEAKWSEASAAAARRRPREVGVQPRRMHPSGYDSQPRESGALPWLWGSDGGLSPLFFLFMGNEFVGGDGSGL